MNIAFMVAQDSDLRAQHGAVITQSGKPVVIATNRKRNCPRTTPGAGEDNYSYHAERLAIKRAVAQGIDLRGAVIYIARNMHGKRSLSRPCNRCYNAIVESGIKKVVYT